MKHNVRIRLAAIVIAAATMFAVAPGAASADASTKTIHAGVGLHMQYQPPGVGFAKGFLFGAVSADHKACLKTTIQFDRAPISNPQLWTHDWKSIAVTKRDPSFSLTLEDSDRGFIYSTRTQQQIIPKPGKTIVCHFGVQWDPTFAN